MRRIKLFKVFNNKLAGYLMFNGCVLQGLDISKNSGDKKMNLYLFNNSCRLQELIDRFTNEHNIKI